VSASAGRLGAASLQMFGATVLLNASMVLYWRLMSGSLGVAYAELAALTGLVNLALVLANGMATYLAKAYSADVALRGPGGLRQSLRASLKPLAVGVAACSLVLGCFSPLVAAYLRLPSQGLYLVAVALVATAFCGAALRAALQGLHRFDWLSASLIGEGLGRLGLSAGLVLGAGLGVWGAMLANLGASALGGALVLPPLLALPRPKAAKTAARRIVTRQALTEMGVDTAALGLFSLLCFLDLFVVKHYRDAAFAADYSRVALVGKSFLYLGSALVMVLLPAVASARAKGQDPRPLLARFLAGHAALLGLGLVLVLAFTPLVIRVLCGSQPEFQAYGPGIRWFCVAVIPLALFQLVLLYHLAMGERRALGMLALLTLAYWMGLELFHGSLLQVVSCLGVASTAALLAGLALVIVKGPRRGGLSADESLAVALQEKVD
jgi:O-antigen/teichoic acid export membrane protein